MRSYSSDEASFDIPDSLVALQVHGDGKGACGYLAKGGNGRRRVRTNPRVDCCQRLRGALQCVHEWAGATWFMRGPAPGIPSERKGLMYQGAWYLAGLVRGIMTLFHYGNGRLRRRRGKKNGDCVRMYLSWTLAWPSVTTA